MHRVDAPGSVSGQFSDGNPAIGQQATQVRAAWLNDLQENVCVAIEESGVELEPGNDQQLLEAIQLLVAGQFTYGENAHGKWRRYPVGVNAGEIVYEIEQRGTLTGPFTEGSGLCTIDFPIDFPTACDNIILSSVNTEEDTLRDAWPQRVGLDTDGATFIVAYPGAGGTFVLEAVEWVAKGR